MYLQTEGMTHLSVGVSSDRGYVHIVGVSADRGYDTLWVWVNLQTEGMYTL